MGSLQRFCLWSTKTSVLVQSWGEPTGSGHATFRKMRPPELGTVSVQTGRALSQTRLESDYLKEARLAFFSEAQLQRELDVPAVAGQRERARPRAHDGVAVGRIIQEVCPVQNVEKLRPELQVPGFTQQTDLG